MEERAKFVFMLGLWGFFGTMVALWLWPPVWWVGMIVGGLGGYIGVDFAEVRRSAPIALRAAQRVSYESFWRLPTASVELLKGVLMLATIAIFAVPLYYFIFSYGDLVMMDDFSSYFFLSVIKIGTVVAAIVCAAISVISFTAVCFFGEEPLPSLWAFNPLLVAFNFFCVMGMFVGCVLWAIGALIYSVFYFGAQGVASLFILIHSEKRLIAMTDIAIAVGVGYLFKSALLGGLAAMIFGILNLEVVAHRLLRISVR